MQYWLLLIEDLGAGGAHQLCVIIYYCLSVVDLRCSPQIIFYSILIFFVKIKIVSRHFTETQNLTKPQWQGKFPF